MTECISKACHLCKKVVCYEIRNFTSHVSLRRQHGMSSKVETIKQPRFSETVQLCKTTAELVFVLILPRLA